MAMDWFSWLSSSSGLDRSLVYEYSLLLSQNELEEDDIVHFDHEFLLSMGIAVAKHRLEILKLAKNHRRRRHQPPGPVAALLSVAHKTCDCLARYVHDLVHRQSKAVVVVPRLRGGRERKVSNVMRRSRRLAMAEKGRLLITDVVCSGVKAVQLGRSPASQSPMALLASREEGHENGFKWVGYKDKEQMRWDSMFQDLKPT